ncbi:YjbH domain-containing protein [Pseudaeromonas sharmana]|uniref:YjbH domain-containing protein n=1 Tax=Pseudaeromonas sharmana TaxID=328412 RepID=A0ABV8CSV0_9GAMM
MTKFSLFSLTLLASAVSAAVHANDVEVARFDRLGPSQSDFGGVGLMQMPTARMARLGEFSANYMDDQEYRRWSLSVQPYDWLETTIRYTDVRTRLYSPYPDFSGDQTYKDKGIDIKLRLWQESQWLPQVSAGVRDFAGTGLFDSEFVVASKRWGDLDFTLGMAWGNMGQSGNIKNPFCTVKESFCQRAGFTGVPGDFEFGNLLHGPAALFGGIDYQTPWQPLRLKLEYDGNDYSEEFAGKITQSSPLNVGAVYRVFDSLDTHLSYQRGNTLMWGITLRTNLNDLTNVPKDAPVVAYQPKQTTEEPDYASLAQQLEQNAGMTRPEIVVDRQQGVATVTGEQTKYRNRSQADQRASRILVQQLPNDIHEYRFIDQREGLPVEERRHDVTAWKQQQDPVLGQSMDSRVVKQTPEMPTATPRFSHGVDRFTYGFAPILQQSWGGPESFYMYQLGLNGNADLHLTKQTWLSGTLYWNWLDNFDQFNYTTPPSDTEALPRVRTWIREYVTSSDLLLTNLQATWMDRIAPDWYAQTYGGYLEMMYAGVGSEVLYRPYGASWAVGVDGNYVRQRDWYDTLQLADYKTFTGHATLYWQLPYIDKTLAQISVGQYLAQDKGVTLNLSRRFDSGVVMGAYATFTDVTAEEYGEGSFTKGFYLTIPLDLLLVHPTTRTGSIGWSPLTRDGGQMLARKYGLYTLSQTQK